jgi:MoxR-like ATPase
MEYLELLDLSQCSTNKEVSEEIRKRVTSVPVEELIKELSNNFVYHEDAVKTVYAALAMNNNAILYGPGGYAKSEIVKAICKTLNIPLICKIGYQDMSPEELFGVPNIKNMLENSKYETAFENSVFCIPGVNIRLQ